MQEQTKQTIITPSDIQKKLRELINEKKKYPEMFDINKLTPEEQVIFKSLDEKQKLIKWNKTIYFIKKN